MLTGRMTARMNSALRRDFMQNLLLALILVFAFLAVKGLPLTVAAISDALAVGGLLLVVVAMWRVVNRLGFFESTKYGYGKLVEIIRTKNYTRSQSSLGTYSDYLGAERTNKPVLSILVISVLMLVGSALLAAYS